MTAFAAPRSFFDGRAVMHHGDSRDVLKTLADNSIDSFVTDPPYALVSIVKRFGKAGAAAATGDHAGGAYSRASAGFMGQEWDTGETAFAVDFWAEVFRVLKPGGHVVAFSGTRTYHRLAVAIEDAGFEIRDQLGWLYGTGFPKSHNVAKGIDKRRKEDAEPVRRVCRFIRAAMDAKGLKSKHLVEHFGGCNARLIDHWAARDTDSQPNLPTAEQFAVLKRVLGFGDAMDGEFSRLDARKGEHGDTWKTAEVVGKVATASPGFGVERFDGDRSIRAASDDARAWDGWGTALKPAWEPIVLARKPMVGTVATNVLAHGTGALNIDACRIPMTDDDARRIEAMTGFGRTGYSTPNGVALSGSVDGTLNHKDRDSAAHDLGRFPANVLHDGSAEVEDAFGLYSPDAVRFFYSAKASKADRAGSKHPTVKPVAVMRWLVRLVTPPGGVIVEPFAGSGSTLQGAIEEGFRVIGIERESQFFEDCCARLAAHSGAPATVLPKPVKPSKPKRAAPLPPPSPIVVPAGFAHPSLFGTA